jgi:hypothetical protein
MQSVFLIVVLRQGGTAIHCGAFSRSCVLQDIFRGCARLIYQGFSELDRFVSTGNTRKTARKQVISAGRGQCDSLQGQFAAHPVAQAPLEKGRIDRGTAALIPDSDGLLVLKDEGVDAMHVRTCDETPRSTDKFDVDSGHGATIVKPESRR